MFIKSIFKKRWVILALQVLLGFTFLYSGFTKLGNLAGFAEAVSNYRLLPNPAINIFAIVLPWVELISGACLLSGILLRGGALLMTVLLIIFTGAVLAGIVRGIDITCGCSTPFTVASRIGLAKLMENAALLAIAVCIFFFGKPTFSFQKSDNLPGAATDTF
jgi:uncharacterized membrane protein YphA (DoxX/SURF4 family)